MMIELKRFCSTTLLVLLGAVSALAQSDTGNIIGTVVDPSGAVVVNATAVLTSASGSAEALTAKSNESGLFRLVDVPAPAHYNLKVDAAGFKALDITAIDLTTNETRDLGKITVQIGAASESVSVEANAVAVQTATADRSSSLETFQMEDVPIKGRDIWAFITTLPGVVDTGPQGAAGSTGLPDRELSTHFSSGGPSFNGMGTGNNGRYLDGISSIDEGSGSSMFLNPTPDMIGEVKVVSTNGQAEYGRNNGGSINFVIKGGSNQFHGSSYWNYRHEDLNANTFFDNRQGVARPLYRYFLGGYTIGGPIIIPKVYRNRNKLFFFGGQDFTQVLIPTLTVMANEPTALERSGNFSASRQSTGTIPPIIDPTSRIQFPGNIIPSSRIDPTGLAILNLQLLPNGYTNPAPGQQYTANFIDSSSAGYHHRKSQIARIDYNINSKNTLFLRAGNETDDTISEFAVAPGIGQGDLSTPNYSFAAHLSTTLSSNMVNEITFGLGHDNFDTIHPEGDSPYYRTSTLSPSRITPLTAGLEPFIPAFTFGGNSFSNQASYNPFGGGPSFNLNDDYALRDDLSKVMGNHNFKTGVYIEDYRQTNPQPNAASYSGTYNFTSTTANPVDTGDSYANALLGVYQTYSETNTQLHPLNSRFGVEFYIQDNWRISHKLTLDYGIRAYHLGELEIINHAESGFYPSLYNPANAPVLYRPGCTVKVTGNCPTADEVSINPVTGATTLFALQGTLVPGIGNPADGMAVGGLTGNGSTYSIPVLVFSPRFGFAWDPFGNGRTVIRGAIGTYFNRPNGISVGSSVGAPLSYTYGLDYGNIDQVSSQAGTAAISPTTSSNAQGQSKIERSVQSNVTIQHQIDHKTVFDIAWIGNYDRHASESITLNPIPEFAYANPANLFNGTEIAQNFIRTAFPGMGAMTYYDTGVNALNYNSLTASLQRREKYGHVEASYVFSKALGYNGWDPYHSASWYYGPLATDRRQSLSLNFAYNLPGIGHRLGFAQHIVNDWILSGVLRAQTGAPVTPSCTSTLAFPYSDPSESGVTARCEAVANPNSYTQSFYANFNTAAFTLAPIGSFGNIGLNTLRDPSWWNLDAGLDKEIPVGKSDDKHKRAFRLRIEAYNALNHTEFNTIGSTYSFGGSATNLANTNTTTGQDTAANSNRVVETTLRFNW